LTGFALFDTPIGRCAIAWGKRGITAIQLPEADEVKTIARLGRRFPTTKESRPPAVVQRTIEGIRALLSGEPSDLSTAMLDLTGVQPFQRRVYQLARSIPPGASASYGELATRLGTPAAARAVGQALARNPFAIVVPCHRVLAAGGKPGGFSASGGTATKRRLLELERGEGGGGIEQRS
jgi:methylated-DNA-[protein]-cysteine S-methyltransferase